MSKKTLIGPTATKQELNRLKRMARHNHGRWIEVRPTATLGDLLKYLRAVDEETVVGRIGTPPPGMGN